MPRRVAVVLLVTACSHPSDGNGDTDPGDCFAREFWIDADGDGFGTGSGEMRCESAPDLAEQSGDCDDANPNVHPGAKELCNGIDDDCDSDNPIASIWYEDRDGDGYGNPDSTTSDCAAPDGFVDDATDCDDDNAAANPGEIEQCDNDFDDDCDDVVADGSDADEDGYLSDACPEGLDCDDAAPGVHPGMVDECDNGIDEDCTGVDVFCGFVGERDLEGAVTLTSVVDSTDAGRLLDVGDTNGDGVDDVLVAAWGSNGAFLVPGPIAATTTFESAGYTLHDTRPASGAGRSIGVGDVDGDGFDDVAVGAPYLDPAGQLIVYGPLTADMDLDTEADVTLVCNTVGLCGHGSELTDVDADGISDAVVAAYAQDSGTGVLYVQFGPLTADVDLVAEADVQVDGTISGTWTGRAVHGRADVDGDGIGDFGVSSIGNDAGGPDAGGVYVVLGPVTITEFSEAVLLIGPEPNGLAGNNFALGDFDGDGFGDVVTAVSYPAPGGAYVTYGPFEDNVDLEDADAILEGADERQYVGYGIASGDMNHDGVDEMIVGAPGNEFAGTNEGVTYVVSDPPVGTSAIADVARGTFHGVHRGDSAGSGVAAGDVDGGGYLELLIGVNAMANGGGVAVVSSEP